MTKRLKILLIIFSGSFILLASSLYMNPDTKDPIFGFVREPIHDYFNDSNSSTNGVEIYHNGTLTKVSDVKVTRETNAPQPKPVNQTYGTIGKKFSLGNFAYTVESATDKGQSYNYQNTTGRYIEVKLLAENIGKTSAMPHTIGIFDSEKRQFGSDPLLGLTFGDGYETYGGYGSQTKPGFTNKIKAVFEVSAKSTGLQLIFANSEGKIIYIVPLNI